MWLVSDVLGEAPRGLVAIIVGGGALSLLLGLWLVRRMLRRVVGKPQLPLRLATYVVAMAVTLVAALAAAGGLLLVAALIGYRDATPGTRVAELQCIDLAPGKLRLYYVPLSGDRRGATQVFDLDGAECTVTGELIRLRTTFHLVAPAFVRTIEISARGAKKPTRFDLRGDAPGSWRWLQARGARGPLRWFTDDLGGNTVAQAADRRAIFDLTAAPGGYALVRRETRAGKP
jgi:hypothetical protein